MVDVLKSQFHTYQSEIRFIRLIRDCTNVRKSLTIKDNCDIPIKVLSN
jgi:hypothetical protein